MKKILACLVLSGCASSGFVPTGADTYMISDTTFGCGMGSPLKVKAGLLKKANRFCDEKGRTLELIDERLAGGFIGSCASAEIEFRCVD